MRSKIGSKIIVIGAGAAGLSAANKLADTGYSTTALEARDRIGGRIYTLREAFCPAPIELGAEFIHGKSPDLFGIVSEAGLLMYDVTERHWFSSGSELIKSQEFGERLDEIMEQMGRRENDESFQAFLNSPQLEKESEMTKSVATKFVEGFHAASIDRIGINGLVKINEESAKIEGDRSFRIVDGYHQVIDYLYRELIRAKGEVRLNTKVKEVYWKNRSVEVRCETIEGEESFEAEHLIVTLPLGVLQRKHGEEGSVRFVPELPVEKRLAIDQLVMGPALKVILIFRERFWEDMGTGSGKDKPDFAELAFMHCAHVPFSTWWTQLPLRAPVLVGWVGGPTAEVCAAEGESSILEHAISSLAALLNVNAKEIRKELSSWFVHDWQSDPFSRGAYSYVPVDGLKAQQALINSVDETIFFAGEATAIGHVGTVHGALVSARRVVKEIQSSN